MMLCEKIIEVYLIFRLSGLKNRVTNINAILFCILDCVVITE